MPLSSTSLVATNFPNDATAKRFAQYGRYGIVKSISRFGDEVLFALHWTSPSVIAELGRIVKPKVGLHLAIPVAGSFYEVRQRFPKLPVLIFTQSRFGWRR